MKMIFPISQPNIGDKNKINQSNVLKLLPKPISSINKKV
jgi:hypothetical protein